jgi:hypothetical protein
MVAQRVTPSTGPPKETICFSCGQKGHYKAKCIRTIIKPVLESGVTNNSSVIRTVLDLLGKLVLPSQQPIAEQNGEANVSPRWSGIVKSAPASVAASAVPRAAAQLHGDRDKPSCADCAKLHCRVAELEAEVRQLKMEISRSKVGNGKSTMNPAAAPWEPQQAKSPEQVPERKSVVAEPARSELHAGSALETGQSPVKSAVESQFSPVLSARSKRALKRQRQNETAAAKAKAEPAVTAVTELNASVDKKAPRSGDQKEVKQGKAMHAESKTAGQQSEEHRTWRAEHDLLLQMVQEKPWSGKTQTRLEKWGILTDKRRWNCVACPGGVDNPTCPQYCWEEWKYPYRS